MSISLTFRPDEYEVKTLSCKGKSISYRAYTGLYYCALPKDPIQKLNLFAPEIYFSGGTISGYDLHSAPIFIPNTVGGYLPGHCDEPGTDWKGNLNSIFLALEHGYVVVSPGIRGRTTGEETSEFFEGSSGGAVSAASGRHTGRAPALIVDLKAVIRYLRHNQNTIPGNTQRIITSGTSAGGALSALAGASGNCPAYEPYLTEIGAARERDDIFAASCYCPIHNLENADAAYEWQFYGIDTYHMLRFSRTPDGHPKPTFVDGVLTEEEKQISANLRALFPPYVNSLGLKDPQNGRDLKLDSDQKGSFLNYIIGKLCDSAQNELDTHDTAQNKAAFMVKGSEVESIGALTIQDQKVLSLNWEEYVRQITCMKAVPAFDSLDLNSPENEEFGTETIDARHFTPYSCQNSKKNGLLADDETIRLMNPVLHIDKADTARHWRIRHGSFDRDTSLAIPAILALSLQNKGYDVDFAYPWGLPHSGDYDLEELFAWIDSLCLTHPVS